MSKDCSHHGEAIGKGIWLICLLNGAKAGYGTESFQEKQLPGWIFLRGLLAISVLLNSQTIF